MLLPVNADTLQLDPKRLDKIRDGARLKAGCLYMDDVPLLNPKNPVFDGDIPHYRPGARLSFGDTPEDDAFCIQWIKCGNGLISDRNLLLDLSWDDLDRQGLAYGKVTKDWSKLRKPTIEDQVNIAK